MSNAARVRVNTVYSSVVYTPCSRADAITIITRVPLPQGTVSHNSRPVATALAPAPLPALMPVVGSLPRLVVCSLIRTPSLPYFEPPYFPL